MQAQASRATEPVPRHEQTTLATEARAEVGNAMLVTQAAANGIAERAAELEQRLAKSEEQLAAVTVMRDELQERCRMGTVALHELAATAAALHGRALYALEDQEVPPPRRAL